MRKKRRHPNGVDGRLRIAAPHVEGFEAWLGAKGYSPATIEELLRLLACWFDWARAQKAFYLADIVATFDASAPAFKGGRTKRAPRGAVALFLEYLRDRGVLPSAPKALAPTERWPILAAFRSFMRQERGARDSTLDNYENTLTRFLDELGADPTDYTASAVRDFTLDYSKRVGRGRIQSVAVATRAFLRFLAATGRCSVSLVHAVPSFPSWSLATTPRFIEPEGVDRVIAACEGEQRLRDRAIILLLARLGMRAGEVANLELSHIDWAEAHLTITGKTRRPERLPLTQEIGDALIAYIERARPRLPSARLFFTEFAPVRPLNRGTIKCLVRRALERAGVDCAHRGAHVLRHSAATGMLRRGVSLAGVGAVLRHRSPAMTLHYAKVDFGLLSEVAQPWIGRLPC
jgi:site-specific recombinase XerD